MSLKIYTIKSWAHLNSQKEKGNKVNEFSAIYPSENVTVKCLSSLTNWLMLRKL